MRQITTLLALAAVALSLTSCGPVEKTARDTIAAATGLIQSAQTEYKAECAALPTAPKCVLVNDGVHGQNAAITALEAYCGFQVGVSLPSDVCKPVKGAEPALTAAIGNLNRFVGEITAIINNSQNKVKTAALDRARNIQTGILVSTPLRPTLGDIEALRTRPATHPEVGL